MSYAAHREKYNHIKNDRDNVVDFYNEMKDTDCWGEDHLADRIAALRSGKPRPRRFPNRILCPTCRFVAIEKGSKCHFCERRANEHPS